MGFHQGISKGVKFVPRAGGGGHFSFWLSSLLQPGKGGKVLDHQLW